MNEGAYSTFNPDTFSLSKLGGTTLTIKCAASNACGTMVSGDSAMLTVNKSEYNTIDTTVVWSMKMGNDVYTESGDHVYRLTTASGCDSIVTLKLNVNHTFSAECGTGQTVTYNATSDSTVEVGSNSLSGNLTIPGQVTDANGVKYKVKSIGDWAFSGCSGLTSVTIPASVTSVGASAFAGCNGLTSVTIPASVTSIGAFAFQMCSGLTSVTIPASVTSIGDWAFDGCNRLTEINVSASNANYQSIDGILYNKAGDQLIICPKGKEGSVTIPNSVTSIGEWTFLDCYGG